MRLSSIHQRIQYCKLPHMKGLFRLKNNIRICEIARELTLEPEFLVGRVIARPFIGEPGNFTRTTNRHDYALNHLIER